MQSRRGKFAFLIHPRVKVGADLGMRWWPLKLVPEPVFQVALAKFKFPPIVWSEVYLDDQPGEPAGWIVLVPYSAQNMLKTHPREVRKYIQQAVDKAAELGADVVGLGALTAPLTKGGEHLASRTDIGVTNGNAFTAAMTFEGVERLRRRCHRPDPHIAIVGASGSIGSCIVHMLAKQGQASRLTLVARHMGRLNALAESARASAPGIDIRSTTDILEVREADIVVLLTSSTENLLRSEHLKPGALVLDDTQPRNTAESLLKERPDVQIIDGGLVAMPGMQLKTSIGLPPHYAYACLAETILLALEGHQGHFSIGVPTMDQVDYITRAATRHRQLGFTLGPFHSFGRPLEQEPLLQWAEVTA